MIATRFVVPAIVAAALAGWIPAAGAVPADPVVAEVLRMLAAGVDPGVVGTWVETSGERPTRVTADDVIALTKAGAPAPLVRRLLELAGPPPAPPRVSDGTVPVRFEIAYRPLRDDTESDPWELYVYLDGHPLAWSPGNRLFSGGPGLRFVQRVPPGPHVLAVLEERHHRASAGRVVHEARVCPDTVTVDAAPESELRLRLEVADRGGFRSARGPLAWELADRGRKIAAADGRCPAREAWPQLCEEVESGLSPGERPGLVARGKLERCVRWSTLWEGAPQAPDRAAARAELERLGFRPTPVAAE